MDKEAVKVCMFGRMRIFYGNKMLEGEERTRPRVWNLLAYFLYHHDRLIAREELLGLFGGTEKYKNPSGALRGLMMRLRRTMEPLGFPADQVFFVRKEDGYEWNPSIAVDLDTERFERLCREGDAAGEDSSRFASYRSALALFHGSFLDYLSGEEWVTYTAEHYRQEILGLIEKILPLYKEQGDMEGRIATLKIALGLSPYHEPYYRELMRLYMEQEDYAQARKVYQDLVQILREDQRMLPEEETQNLNIQIEFRMQTGYIPLHRLRMELTSQGEETGAMVCDFSQFKLLYLAKSRQAERWGTSIHIGVLTVHWAEGKKKSSQRFDSAMEALCSVIRTTLRKEDVVSRCSKTQYILMMPWSSLENSEKVCLRVVNAFKMRYPSIMLRIDRDILF